MTTTVNEVTRRRDHVIAGSATLAYDFPILDSNDLHVLVNGVLTTDYVVNGVGADAGGTIVLNVLPANGVRVTILGDQPYKQVSTYTTEAFPPSRIQNDFNKRAIAEQQLVEIVRRTLRAQEVDNLDMTLPSVASRNGRVLGFDSTGLPVAVPLPDAAGGDISLATVIASGSITARSLAERFGEIINVKDYGAVGDGVTDDAPAINAAIAVAAAASLGITPTAGNGIVFFPAGTYLVNSPIDLTNKFGVTLQGAGPNSFYGYDSGTPGRTTIYGNTGATAGVVDMVGGSRLKLNGLNISVMNTATDSRFTDPSLVGIIMGRSTANHFAEMNELNNVRVNLEGVTSGFGRVGLYNVGSEHLNIIRSSFKADHPSVFADSDVYGVVTAAGSFYETGITMSASTIMLSVFTMLASTLNAGTILFGAQRLTFFDCFWIQNGGSQIAAAVQINDGAILHPKKLAWYGMGIEQIAAAFEINTDMSELIIDHGQIQEPSGAYVGLAGKTISNSHIQITQDSGTRRAVIGPADSSSTLKSSIVHLATSAGISGINIRSSILLADDATASTVVPVLGSDYILLGSKGANVIGGRRAASRTEPTYGVSIAIDASLGDEFDITATNGTAFTVTNPTNPADGQRITLTIRNTSGGALGTITWESKYKLAAWTSPATGTSRSIDFKYDGTNWIEASRTPADVPI